MRLRILDRILVAVAGLLLLACCAGIVAQLFFNVNLVDFAAKAFQSERTEARIALIAAAVLLLLLGLYCVAVLFRHRKRKDKFILQRNDNGELAISVKALENMVQKCLDQHREIDVKNLYLENRKDGLLIRIRGSVAGGISIPLTVEALQKQIRQYVTACSGVEVKGIRVQIESSGEDAKDAPFAIAPPAAKPLLHEAAEKPAPEPVKPVESMPADNGAQPAAVPGSGAVTAPPAAEIPTEEEDDRPLHQRLFSPKQEPCIVPVPPAEEKAQEEAAPASTPEQDAAAEPENAESEPKDAEAQNAPAEEQETREEEKRGEADPAFLESLKAFDDLVTGNGKEDDGK